MARQLAYQDTPPSHVVVRWDDEVLLSSVPPSKSVRATSPNPAFVSRSPSATSTLSTLSETSQRPYRVSKHDNAVHKLERSASPIVTYVSSSTPPRSPSVASCNPDEYVELPRRGGHPLVPLEEAQIKLPSRGTSPPESPSTWFIPRRHYDESRLEYAYSEAQLPPISLPVVSSPPLPALEQQHHLNDLDPKFHSPHSHNSPLASKDEKPPSPSSLSALDLEVEPPTRRSPLRHPEFYFEDGMATFLVENLLYKVHRFFLQRESETFRQLLRLNADEKAIPLVGTTAREFESLLEFFYNGMHNDVTQSPQHWMHLLAISTRFDFVQVRKRAISEIDAGRVDPVDKIILAENYGIPQWLAPSYEALCQRENALEVFEAERLGARKTALVARARETLRDHSVGRCASSQAIYMSEDWGCRPKDCESPRRRPAFDPSEVSSVVREVFKI